MRSMPSMKTMGKEEFQAHFEKEKENRTLPRGVGSYWDLDTTHRDVHVKTPMGHGILESQDKNPNAHGLYVLKVRLAWGIMYVPSLHPDPRLAAKETGEDTGREEEYPAQQVTLIFNLKSENYV